MWPISKIMNVVLAYAAPDRGPARQIAEYLISLGCNVETLEDPAVEIPRHVKMLEPFQLDDVKREPWQTGRAKTQDRCFLFLILSRTSSFEKLKALVSHIPIILDLHGQAAVEDALDNALKYLEKIDEERPQKWHKGYDLGAGGGQRIGAGAESGGGSYSSRGYYERVGPDLDITGRRDTLAGFRRMRAERARSAPIFVDPSTSSDAMNVDCSIFAPSTMPRGTTHFVQVFLHVPDDAAEVRGLASQSTSNIDRQITRSLTRPIPLGSVVDIFINGNGLEVRHEKAETSLAVRQITWRGTPISVEFAISCPCRAVGTFRDWFSRTKEKFLPTVVLCVDGTIVGKIVFEINLGSTREAAVCTGRATNYRRAFLSYASEDRVEVLKRAQALRAAQITFFQDVLTLNPGDRWRDKIYKHIDDCDLFLIFWSQAARKSKWVRREISYALAKKKTLAGGRPDILPLLLERPPVPPPYSLRHLHFDDPISYVMQAVEASGRAKDLGSAGTAR